MNHHDPRIRYLRSGGSPAGRRDPFASLRARAAGPIGRALALAAGALVLVAALFVSAVVFSVLLVAGAIAGGWFWWQTRGLRREIRERLAQMQQMQQMQAGAATTRPQAAREPSGTRGAAPARARPAQAAGEVIDGDFIRESEPPAS
jgi:hypothetical protein